MILFLAVLSLAFASETDRQAIQCIKNFVDKYEASSGYSTHLKKTEFEFGKPLVENLRIEERNRREIVLTFVDEGQSGIKNNGMKVTYSGGDEVELEFGRSRGFGIILNGLAEAFTVKKRKLFDSEVLDKQIFTVNRAGFGYFARTLKSRLKQMEKGELGQLELRGKNCSVSFKSNQEISRLHEVSASDSIQSLEEKYGTLAYIIFKDNQSKFKNFADLFQRKSQMELQLSEAFADFNLELYTDGSPKIFELFWKGSLLGRYEFSDTTFNN